MLTIFSIPKPFQGHIGLIQSNAIASWTRLNPRPEVVLMGDDNGVAEAAAEFKVQHVPVLRRNEFGTPLVTDAFRQAGKISQSRLLMYSNADMIYNETLLNAAEALSGCDRFVMSGRRYDIDVKNDLAHGRANGWNELRTDRATLHGPAGMDYFIYPREMDFGMPDLAVGRVAWDSWLVYRCRRSGVPVVDATLSIVAFHQNHDYSSLKLGYQHRSGVERDLNLKAAGGLGNLMTLREASHLLVGGRLVRPRGMRAVVSALAPFRFYQKCLGMKRWVQQAI